MTAARKHHYLSQFYLRNFCDARTSPDRLHVLDVGSGDWFQTSTANVGAERDFNRVKVADHEIDALENALAQFEGEAAPAVQRLINGKRLPDNGDLNCVINMICLYACRNPRIRAAFNHARKYDQEVLAQLLVSDEATYQSHMEKAIAAGYVQLNDVSYAEMKQFVKSGENNIEIPADENHRVEFDTFDKVLPLLGQRSWTLLVVEPDGPEVISCDHPVVVTHKDPGINAPVGLGTKNTELIFPISRELFLYGVYETPLKTEVVISAERVATFNTRIAFNAERHVYSSQPHFVMRRKGKIASVRKKI
jgi:Protein of unknown function (DUF4238)